MIFCGSSIVIFIQVLWIVVCGKLAVHTLYTDPYHSGKNKACVNFFFTVS